MTSQFPADSNVSPHDRTPSQPHETLDDILGSVGTPEPVESVPGEPIGAEMMTAEIMTAEIMTAEIMTAEPIAAEPTAAEPTAAARAAVEPTPEPTPDPTPDPTPEPTPDPPSMFAPIVESPPHSATDLADLQAQRDRLQAEIQQAQTQLNHLFQDSLGDLERRRQNLQLSIEQLERRHERIRAEMRSTFAGSSQEVAVRVQSFKDYLVGSLQDLVRAADQLELVREVPTAGPVATSGAVMGTAKNAANGPLIPVDGPIGTIQFAEPSFADKSAKIRQVIELFRNEPDYYGPAWKLRRTFESVHAERINEWFFTQGGRGAVRTVGSRLQNILVASAAISILYNLYGDRLRPLILANSPERLGEWRRGLQDCLGVGKNDFGADRGLTLFELPEPLSQRADRIQKDGKLPLIIIDETEEFINLSVLQFPLWIAFAPNPQSVPQPSYFY
jgi:Protein of unknown function (DUF3086)